MLDTSGIISGTGTISAVLQCQWKIQNQCMENYHQCLFQVPIREEGGFYDVAKNFISNENAKVSFSIIPTESKSLMQLRVSTNTQLKIKLNQAQKLIPCHFSKLMNSKDQTTFQQETIH